MGDSSKQCFLVRSISDLALLSPRLLSTYVIRKLDIGSY